mmetsp:Transcript_1293/g.4385  ORF Transcript_1293/g.4385 Transcript_1293/m.4385 type:complete len:299 (-) Transcript_1293:618-1514(-)
MAPRCSRFSCRFARLMSAAGPSRWPSFRLTRRCSNIGSTEGTAALVVSSLAPSSSSLAPPSSSLPPIRRESVAPLGARSGRALKRRSMTPSRAPGRGRRFCAASRQATSSGSQTPPVATRSTAVTAARHATAGCCCSQVFMMRSRKRATRRRARVTMVSGKGRGSRGTSRKRVNPPTADGAFSVGPSAFSSPKIQWRARASRPALTADATMRGASTAISRSASAAAPRLDSKKMSSSSRRSQSTRVRARSAKLSCNPKPPLLGVKLCRSLSKKSLASRPDALRDRSSSSTDDGQCSTT